jgi:hypothetical protein
MSEQRHEYRLRWQRVGRKSASRILQTERVAVEKANFMLAANEANGADDGYTLLPDLVWMKLERRVVGEWSEDRAWEVAEPDPDSAVAPERVGEGDNFPW